MSEIKYYYYYYYYYYMISKITVSINLYNIMHVHLLPGKSELIVYTLTASVFVLTNMRHQLYTVKR